MYDKASQVVGPAQAEKFGISFWHSFLVKSEEWRDSWGAGKRTRWPYIPQQQAPVLELIETELPRVLRDGRMQGVLKKIAKRMFLHQ